MDSLLPKELNFLVMEYVKLPAFGVEMELLARIKDGYCHCDLYTVFCFQAASENKQWRGLVNLILRYLGVLEPGFYTVRLSRAKPLALIPRRSE